jgi:hypothetical protein
LCDGALHVFSAGAATVEERHARMKLPVRSWSNSFSEFTWSRESRARQGAEVQR